MSQSAANLTALALELSEEERIALASKLIDSVEGPPDEEWEQAWATELERRRTHGFADARPWNDVREQVLRRLNRS